MKSNYLVFFLIILFFCTPLWAEQSEHEMLFPVIIKGEQLKQILGKNIENIRVFSFHNGSLSAIPFQVDQKDSNNNWVWDIVSGSAKHKMSDNEDPLGEKIFDNNDQLLFMAADMGEKMQKPSLMTNASIILELEIFVNEAEKASEWVYITYHSLPAPPLSDTHYMSYQAKTNVITSPVYSLSYSKHLVAAIDDMSISGQSIINQTRIHGKVDVGFLVFNHSIEFNEKEIGGSLVGYIRGPIRITKRFINYIKLGAGMQSGSLIVDHLFYANHIEVPVVMTKGLLVKNMSLKIGANYPDENSFPSIKTLKDINVKRRNETISANNSLQLLAIDGANYSMFSMIKIPKKLSSTINSTVYINDVLSSKLSKGMSTDKNQQAGFYLETKDDFPSGQYQLNIISIFSNRPHLFERDTYYKNNNKVSVFIASTNVHHL